MWFSTQSGIKKVSQIPRSVGAESIFPSEKVRSLGVVLDRELKLKSHIAAITSLCFFQLRQIRHIRRYLSMDAAKTLVQSFVSSRIDYCNSLLANAPEGQINGLQRILNASARMVLKLDRSVHVLRPLVRDQLHWLRAPERIEYKLCTLVYKSLHGLAPSYLAELCKPVDTVAYRGNLRSAARGELVVPRHKLSTYGTRAFCIAGPSAWNALPITLRNPNLRNFCKDLKTHLFKKSYVL